MADELPEEHPTMEEAELGGEAELEEGAAEGEEWPEDHGEGEAMEVEHGEAMEGETGEAEGTEAAEAAEAAEGEEHEDGNWWGTEAETAEAEAGEVQAEAETAEADGEAEVHEGHDEGHDEGHEGHEVEGHDGHDGHEAHEGEMEVEAPNPDDPTAPVQMDVGWEAAAWLQEEDGRRLRKLERLSGGEAEVTEEGLLKLVPLSQLAPAGGVGTGHSWCDLCARLLCALRTGEEIELSPGLVELAEAEADIEGLGLFVLEVPGAVEKKAIAGKDGAKLLELCDASDVLAAFTWANESHSESEPVHPKVGDILEGKYGDSYFEVEVIDAPEGGDVKVKWAFDGSESELPVTDLKQKAGGAEIKAGDTVEAKYGDSWHDAEVISVEEDGKVKIKWGFDSSEADLDAADVRGKAEAAEASGDTEHVEVVQADLKEGDKVQAKYGDSFHDAEVIQPQTDDGNVKIKWGFDDSEAEVTCKDLRAKVEPPPPPPAKLLVLGKGRPRMALEVRVLNKIESKLPGHVASLQKVSIEGNVGLTVMDLKPGGDGTLGKLIGKQGATKLKIERMCGCTLEYMGKDTDNKQAFIVGTADERSKTQALLELLTTAVDFRVKATEFPPALKDLSSALVVPGHASAAVTGKLDVAPLQDATDTLVVALAKPPPPVAPKKDFATNQVVECKFKGEWVEATILEISSWADSDDEDDTDGRTMKVKLASGAETTALGFNVREKLSGAEAAEREQELQRQQQRELFVIGTDPQKRREAQLRLAAMLEAKSPGAFSGEQAVDGDRLAVTSMSIGSATLEQDFLKRLGVASNCEILLEDQIAYFASGSSFECARAESFLKPFLTEEGKEAADANKVDDIDGINFILIEREKQTNLPPRVLNDVADKLGVVAFFDDGATLAGVEDNVRLNVICWDVEKQTAALEMLKELQDQEPPPEETWEDDKWNEDQKDDWKNEGQDEWKKDDWSKDDGNKDWKKDDWKKDDGKSNDWKKDDWKNDKKDDWKKDNWQKDDWKKDDGKSNDWKKKDDWKKDEWKKEDDWKSNDKKRKWEEEDKNSWGNDKKSKNDWGGDKSGGWGKEKNEWDKSGGGGGGGGWNQQKSWEKDNDKSGGGGGGGKWGSSEKSWEDKSWKKDTGSDWKDDKKSWDQGKKWGQDQQDNAWKGGGKDDWSNKKDDWNSKDNSKQSAQWEKKDAWGQKKQEKDAWSQKNDSWQQDKGDAWGGSKSWESNGASKAWGQNQGQSKRQWPQDNQDDTKRWRTEATPSSAPRTASTRTAPWQRNAVTNVAAYNSTPKQVLDSLPGGYPDSIDDWKKIQRQVWRNAPQIPNGWIRVWSKKHDCEYYLRLNDNYATFELNEVK